MSVKSMLNYWMSKHQRGEFIGFVDLIPEAHFGQLTEKENIAPMYLFQDNTGWGDKEQTSNKFSWVLHILGTDDTSVYMLFGAKEGALKYAMELIGSEFPLDPWSDTYKDRKWCWQN